MTSDLNKIYIYKEELNMEKSCDNCKYERSRTESVQPYEEPCISCNGNTNWVEYEEEYDPKNQ